MNFTFFDNENMFLQVEPAYGIFAFLITKNFEHSFHYIFPHIIRFISGWYKEDIKFSQIA